MWVVTQSVIGNLAVHAKYPVGMLGVHFDTSSASLINEIATALKVYALGVKSFMADPPSAGRSLSTHHLSCEQEGKSRWDTGEV